MSDRQLIHISQVDSTKGFHFNECLYGHMKAAAFIPICFSNRTEFAHFQAAIMHDRATGKVAKISILLHKSSFS